MAMKIRLDQLPGDMTVAQMLASYQPFNLIAYLSLENAPVSEWVDEPETVIDRTTASEPQQPHVMHPDTKRCVSCGIKVRQSDRGRRCEPGPRHGQIDRDIQAVSTEEIEPTSVGQHVAIQNTLQARRDGVQAGTCGNQECSNAPEPGKRYCCVRCRTRQASILRKRREDEVGGRAARKAARTPVPGPEVEVMPASPPPRSEDEAPVSEPDVASVQAQPVPLVPTRPCFRCGEEGHFQEDCRFTSRRAAQKAKAAPSAPAPSPAPVEDASQRAVRQAKERLQASKKHDAGQGPQVITCGRCRQKGHSIFTCSKPQEPAVHLVRAPRNEPLTDDELTAHSTSLQALCREGLPDHFQYSYKDEVLALYGVDTELMDAAIRTPERVEIRPESHDKEKRYCILGFHRGDLQVILGMRNPGAPMVIAAYANSRLEHDTHRVGHTGGGGTKTKVTGLPKTSRAVAQRLRMLGGRELEVEIDSREDHTEVVYKGQVLGKIATNGDRATCEQDFQRIQRKMAAIDRRVV